ncbi:c-type cytochrome [bacterium]|nr:c-type cytochrome [bacterium]
MGQRLFLFAFLFLIGSFAHSSQITMEELGKTLYFDPRLSADGTISCNSCHNVMASGEDNRSFSMGIKGQRGGRSAPTVFNATFLSVQFWDGRAKDLAEQAKGPLINPVEMGNKDHKEVVSRVGKIPGYVQMFDSVFGKRGLNIDNLAKAIAAYEKTLTTLNSPFDEYKKGNKSALSALAQKGYNNFQTIGCVTCHSGDHFAGPALPVGQGFYMKFPTFDGTDFDKKYQFTKDLGRFDVTKKEEDKHMFRVPTLRNVAKTAPYFHNGAVKTLEEAVRVMAKVQLNKDLKADEAKSLVAFLESLSGTIPPQTMPTLPPTLGFVVTETN